MTIDDHDPSTDATDDRTSSTGDRNDTEGWRAGLDDIDAALLDGYQSGFPVRPAPFEVLASAVGTDEDEILDRVRGYVDCKLVRRLGPVLDPGAIGASTLAALRVPDDEVGDVAAVVDEFTEVSHNYRRDHEWNVWFVLTAATVDEREAILGEIASRTGHDPLSLPKRRTYCLDLQFPIVGDRTDDRTADCPVGERDDERAPDVRRSNGSSLTDVDRAVLEEIQDGLPLSTRPYADVADALGVDTATAIERIEWLLSRGYLKRIGLVVDHRTAGYRANCMVVWAVPEDDLDAAGRRAGANPHVTKCYHRPSRPDRGWEYTLFTMVHGREPAAVDRWIDELAADIGHPHERLETVERLKQTGTQYDRLFSGDDSPTDRG